MTRLGGAFDFEALYFQKNFCWLIHNFDKRYENNLKPIFDHWPNF
jgi:hypothetical protein